MRLYIDMCALKRPFDDQTQNRIASETSAFLAIVARVEQGVDTFVWSTSLTLENDADPDAEVRIEVGKFAKHAESLLTLTPQVEGRLKSLAVEGLRPLDAAHVAFAEAATCDVLITCDDRLIARARRAGCLISVMSPLEYLEEIGHDQQAH
jgi:predicted nucleic acid-binding protein